jgi:RNA polymerase sigma factor (TIGR02999 family)
MGAGPPENKVDIRAGGREAVDSLFPRIYEELRGLARQRRRRWKGDLTLNTTALVHEAYLRLMNQSVATVEDRARFMAVASRAMRHILIDYARRRKALKRGRDVQEQVLDEMLVLPDGVITFTDAQANVVHALHEALEELEQIEPRQSRIVECRFFGQMTIEETAMALAISPNTVKRDWRRAQVWLFRTLRESGTTPSAAASPS